MPMTNSSANSWTEQNLHNNSVPTTEYSFIPLSKLLSLYGEEMVAEKLKSFIPHKDSSTGSFLREKAIMMEKKDLSRTFLAVSKSHHILGFVTLGMKCLTIPKDNLLSNNVMSDMNIDKKTGVAQSYLLGQLARSVDSPSGIGKNFLDYAISKFKASKENVGCRMVRLDCTDDLINYYTKNRFRPICKNSDGDLNQMMIFI